MPGASPHAATVPLALVLAQALARALAADAIDDRRPTFLRQGFAWLRQRRVVNDFTGTQLFKVIVLGRAPGRPG